MAVTNDCPHGSNVNRFMGQAYNAPFSRCECCGVFFPYCDMATYSTAGSHGKTWIPKTACGACGGKYVEF